MVKQGVGDKDKTMSMMVIEHTDNQSEFNRCSNRKHIGTFNKPGIEIPVFYSISHAIRHGWRKTKDLKYCPPGEAFAWVCPGCAKLVDWRQS